MAIITTKAAIAAAIFTGATATGIVQYQPNSAVHTTNANEEQALNVDASVSAQQKTWSDEWSMVHKAIPASSEGDAPSF